MNNIKMSDEARQLVCDLLEEDHMECSIDLMERSADNLAEIAYNEDDTDVSCKLFNLSHELRLFRNRFKLIKVVLYGGKEEEETEA